MMVFLVLGLAFLIGLLIGWNWKPKWVFLVADQLFYHFFKFKGFASGSCFNSLMVSIPIAETGVVHNQHCSSSQLNEQQFSLVNCLTEEDVQHLYKLIHMKDGGPPWMQMMDRSASGMSYQAWTRDPKSGPTQYRSRTVFENATPEIVRDFFWDDEFRANWDDMLSYSNTIQDCAFTGTMLVQWIRKFPFFCREYVIVRRIWESNGSYYCVTKGVNCPSVPQRDKPKRVDLYYSSWYIRAVKSRTDDGQPTACEVIFFHHEEMGIPREIAKLAVRHGMWGTVKKFEPSLRAYQKARSSGLMPLSRSALLAQISTTKINPESLSSMALVAVENEAETVPKNKGKNIIPKWLIVGGAIIIVCSIDKGLLTKTFLFGLGRRFANIGKRLHN